MRIAAISHEPQRFSNRPKDVSFIFVLLIVWVGVALDKTYMFTIISSLLIIAPDPHDST